MGKSWREVTGSGDVDVVFVAMLGSQLGAQGALEGRMVQWRFTLLALHRLAGANGHFPAERAFETLAGVVGEEAMRTAWEAVRRLEVRQRHQSAWWHL
jgi:hypothetical protein